MAMWARVLQTQTELLPKRESPPRTDDMLGLGQFSGGSGTFVGFRGAANQQRVPVEKRTRSGGASRDVQANLGRGV
jgi:hypothetical protein